MLHRTGWALCGALALLAVLALARALEAGPLDPPGPVGSTMRTLDELLPSWGRTLSSSGGCTSERFACVMNDEAVLDRETGLVWQREPTGAGSILEWDRGVGTCAQSSTGGRRGWRTPTISEAFSLLDPAIVAGNVRLPAGHPFVIAPAVETALFATASSDSATAGYYFTLAGAIDVTGKNTLAFLGLWCVRGSGGEDND